MTAELRECEHCHHQAAEGHEGSGEHRGSWFCSGCWAEWQRALAPLDASQCDSVELLRSALTSWIGAGPHPWTRRSATAWSCCGSGEDGGIEERGGAPAAGAVGRRDASGVLAVHRRGTLERAGLDGVAEPLAVLGELVPVLQAAAVRELLHAARGDA
ncbi:unnamed protein product, partial [Prorocentrum cordatum]